MPNEKENSQTYSNAYLEMQNKSVTAKRQSLPSASSGHNENLKFHQAESRQASS
jgi:negative regulator of sigma E activity